MNAENSQHEVMKPRITGIEAVLMVTIILIIASLAYSGKPTYGNSCSKFYELDISDVQCSEIQSYVRQGWSLKVVGDDVIAVHPRDLTTVKHIMTTSETN